MASQLSIDDSWAVVTSGAQQFLGKVVERSDPADEGVTLCPAYNLLMSVSAGNAPGAVVPMLLCFPIYLTSKPEAELHIGDVQCIMFFSSISIADKHKFASIVKNAENMRERSLAKEAGLVLPNGQ